MICTFARLLCLRRHARHQRTGMQKGTYLLPGNRMPRREAQRSGPEHGGGESTANLGYIFICECVTLPLLQGNDMAKSILTLHFCSIHDLLFCPALQEWLSFSPVQIEHTFGKAMRLTERACPRCTTIMHEALAKRIPTLYPSSVPRKAAGF